MPKKIIKKTETPKLPKFITRRSTVRLQDVKKKNPELLTPELEEAADGVDKAHALDVMAGTEGAKVLVDSLISDSISNINTLTNGYKKLTHTEMIAICAELSSNLAIALVITRAKLNRASKEESLKTLIEDALKT